MRDERADALGMADGEPEARRAAARPAQHAGAGDAEVVEQPRMQVGLHVDRGAVAELVAEVAGARGGDRAVGAGR